MVALRDPYKAVVFNLLQLLFYAARPLSNIFFAVRIRSSNSVRRDSEKVNIWGV